MNFKNNTDNLDQHFLVSETVINKFSEASNLTKKWYMLRNRSRQSHSNKNYRTQSKKLTVLLHKT